MLEVIVNLKSPSIQGSRQTESFTHGSVNVFRKDSKSNIEYLKKGDIIINVKNDDDINE